MKIDLSSGGEVSFMGFDSLTDDEIMQVMDSSPDPELMGGKLRKWFKRRRKRARAFFKKVKSKYRKLPKWAKIATGVALIGPLAVGAPIAAGVAIGKARNRRRAMLAKMTPEQRRAYLKKRKRRLRIASMFIPGVAPIAATAMAVKGIRQRRKRRRIAKRRSSQRRLSSAKRRLMLQKRKSLIAARRRKLAAAKKAPQRITKKMVPVKKVAAKVPEKKPGGLGPLLALGALGIPFLLGT